MRHGTRWSGFPGNCLLAFPPKPHVSARSRKCRVLQAFRGPDVFRGRPVVLSFEIIVAVSRVRRFSSPLINPASIRETSSSRALSCNCSSPWSCPRQRASFSSGTDSCSEPRAIVKKLRRSALVKRPLPSARLVLMERAARLSWSATKP